MRANRGSVWVERLLILIGMVCLGWWTTMTVHGWYFRAQQMSEFERLAKPGTSGSLPPVAEPVTPIAARVAPQDPAGLVGILDVPRLGISTPVISGDDERALDLAVGHLPDTPLPWQAGNSAVAAHRDGLFRPLQRVRRGDVVRMRTTHGDFEYAVRDMKVVEPDDLSVLDAGSVDALTLITCYPFGYIGHAPRRFVVRAERVGAAVPPQRPPVPAAIVTPVAETTTAAAGGPATRVSKPRVAKSANAKSAKSLPRASKQSHKRETAARHQPIRPEASRGSDRTAPRPADRKDDRVKKRRWYRLFF